VPNVREENVREEAAVEVAAGADEAQDHVHELDHDEEAMVAEQVMVDTQEDDDRAEDEIGESTTDRTELDEVIRRQEGGEQTLPVAGTTTAARVDGPSELEEMPETVAVEREQEPTDHEEGVEEEGELTSLVQQPEAVEEAAGVARLFGGRGLGESVWHMPHSFSFSPPKRDRKLSDEGQQEEAKRPKSPAKEDAQQAEQHGSRGEGGEEMETDMREILLGVGSGSGSGSTRPFSYPGLDSARRQQHFK
jgi:hypothetical protein